MRVALYAAFVIACGPSSRQPTGDDTLEPDAPYEEPPPCEGASCNTTCAPGSKDLVYVLDNRNHLHSFDPKLLAAQGTGAFVDLGELKCNHSRWPIDGSDDEVTPMSMSVDREGYAWVHYTSGEIFRAHVDHPDQCTSTGYVAGQAGMDLFGMGFVSETNGSTTERLYIGGGDLYAAPGGDLASIDPAMKPPKATKVGKLTNEGERSPELTGTGGGELWAFFPGINRAWVQQLDRTTGALEGPKKEIPNGLGGLGATPQIHAWAFAQWGGTFYIFVTTSPGMPFPPNSSLRTIDSAGVYQPWLDQMPWVIVGAGVSTCAPFVIL